MYVGISGVDALDNVASRKLGIAFRRLELDVSPLAPFSIEIVMQF